MNGRCLLSIVLVVMMLTSGPLALPVSIYLSQSPPGIVNASPDLAKPPKMSEKLLVEASSSATSCSSPVFVSLTARIKPDNMTQFIQLYKWDFDGDGVDDYVSLDKASTTHVYESLTSTQFEATLTVVMTDSSTSKGSVLINVEPTDPSQWLEIRDMGPAKFGVNANGSIIIYDQTSWIPLTFAKNAETLKNPTVSKAREDRSRVTYTTKSTLLDVNMVYGAEGMATFNITEYLPPGGSDPSKLGGLTLPKGVAKGGLVFSYLDAPPKIEEPHSVVNVLYFPKVQAGSGNVWGTGGASYSPWRDQGVTPYGEYFKGLQEYVAAETGYLTVTQSDLNVPGRGIDLVIKRVSAPPSTFDGWSPASAADYTYQNNPWAPMGNGWSLSFPWMETSGGTPTYIHLGNGQRYKYNSTNGGTNEYHSGDHFKLYKYANGTYALYTVDGVKYVFDSSCKPTKIIDVDGNQITFTYTSNKITSITDTIGRTATLSYNGDGLVSSISTGGLSASYTYVNGVVTGKKLATVTDPQGRVTRYRYFTDYLISQIEYPSGGYSTYTYGAYYSSGYSRYRIMSQTIHDSAAGVSSYKTYTYTATYGSVTDATIMEYASGALVRKTVLDYSQSTRVSESVYDGASNRFGKTNQFIDSTHRRKTVDKYLGASWTYNETITRFDSWGNAVYEKEYLGHIRYSSYLNTDSSGKYVDSNGAQVRYFTDSFYGSTPNTEIHNLLVGEAGFQSGVGSLPIESYYKYDSQGHGTEAKQLMGDGWLVTSTSYDSYGNPMKVTDSNGYLTYYIYNSTYSGAYLTSTKRTLVGSPSQNVTASYGYNSTSGLIIREVDEKGNTTSYKYDKVGRTTNVTYPRVNGIAAKESAVYYDDAVYTSTYSPTTVVTATSTPYVSWTGRYIIRALGVWWAFYCSGTTVYCKSSADGSTWSSPTGIIYYLEGGLDNWGMCFDGTYFHFTGDTYTSYLYRLLYIRGTPHSDGTITLGSTQTISAYDSSAFSDSKIAADSNGYAWIAYKHSGSYGTGDSITVIKNLNKDGTWSTDGGSSYYSGYVKYSTESHFKWAPLTSGKMALLLSCTEKGTNALDLTCMVYNGASWGSKETIVTWASSLQPYDAAAVGDDVYAAYGTDSNGVQFKRRDYNSATWGTASNIVSNRPVQLTRTDWRNIYATYVSGSNINYKVFDGSTWSSEYTLVSGDSPMSVNAVSAAYQATDSRVGVVYQKSSGGYTVRFEILSLRETRSPSMTTLDELGNKVISYYDGMGRLVETERYNGTTLYSTESQTYNYLGLTASKTTATGQVYTYDYTGVGDLVKTTNPDSSYSSTTISYTYNTWDTLDEVGRRKILTYDCMGRLTKVKEYYDATHFYTSTYTYDESGNLVKVTDGSGHDTCNFYDQLNWLVETKYSDGSAEAQGYDAGGNLRWKVDRNGAYIGYTYDSLNRLTKTSHLSGAPWLTMDRYRKPVTVSGSTAGAQSSYQIPVKVYYGSGADGTEALGRSTAAKVYAGSLCRTDFGDVRFTSGDGTTELDYYVEDYSAGSWALFWVEAGYIPASPGEARVYIYYGNSTITSTSSGADTFPLFDDFEDGTVGSAPTGWTQIAKGASDQFKVASDQVKQGSKSLYMYEAGGDSTSVAYKLLDSTPVMGGLLHAWVRTDASSGRSLDCLYQNSLDGGAPLGCFRDLGDWRYANYGVSMWISVPNFGQSAANTWYRVESMVRQSDLKAAFCRDRSLDSGWVNGCMSTAQGLDGVKLQGDYSYPAGSWWDQMYIRKYVSPEPVASSIGSVEDRDQFNATPIDLTQGYDGAGNRVSSAWNGTSESWVYDARNRLTKESYTISGTGYNMRYGYDAAGNVIWMMYPSGENVSLTYDNLNRLSELGSYATVTYTLDDKMDLITYSNGVCSDYSYDTRSRPHQIRVYEGSTTLLNCTYTYDGSGSITQIRNATATESYGYDQLDRLTSTTGPWGSITYTYDAVGNMLSRGSTSYTYDSMNRLTRAGASDDYAYDSNGNLVSREAGADTWTYGYNGENQLVWADKNSAIQRRYSYDADGRRVMSYGGASGNLRYVYSGLNVVYEVSDGGGNGTLRFYAGGLQIAEKTGSTVTYLHQDHLGSTRLMTDSNGDRVFNRNYAPFGSEVNPGGSEEFRYTGKPTDSATGLYYFGARYYDPSIGRFITEDSTAPDLTDPQSFNRYVYCRNNPHKYIDPDGKIFMLILGAGMLFGTINAVAYWATHRDNFDTREFGGAFATGFVGGIIGGTIFIATGGLGTGAVATIANAPIPVLSTAAKVTASVIVSTVLTAPAVIATDMVAREATGREQMTGQDVLENYRTTVAVSYVSSVIISNQYFPTLEPELSLATKKTIDIGLNYIATVIDKWWEDQS